MSTKIQLRRGTATQWTSANPVLAAGEVGYETDTGSIKVGTGATDGTGTWTSLPYFQLPNVSVNPATTSDLNATNYRVMGRYRLNTITSGMTLVNGPSDLDSVDADSVCTLLVTTHAYESATTHVQQTLTQFSASGTALKQWVRLYNNSDWTAWTSTAHLSDNEVTTAKIADATDASTGVTNSKLRQSGALSVIGRSANTLGAPADISATAASGAVLRESGSTIGFGTISADGIAADAVTTAKILNANVTTAKIADDAVTADKLADDASTDGNRAVTTNHIRNSNVTFAKLQNSAAAGLSVIGRSANSAGVFAEIAAGTDGHVLRRSGTAVEFGTIVNAGVDAAAGIALSKLASLSANRVVGVTTAGVPTELTTGSSGTARTALGLTSNAYLQAPRTLTGQFAFTAPSTTAGLAVSDLNIGEMTVMEGTISAAATNNCTLRMNLTGAQKCICYGFYTGGAATGTASAFVAPYIANGANANLITGAGSGGSAGTIGVLLYRIA